MAVGSATLSTIAAEQPWDGDASGALKCVFLALFGSDLTRKGGGGELDEHTPYILAVATGELATAAAILLLTSVETWPTSAEYEEASLARARVVKSRAILVSALAEALRERSREPLTRLLLEPTFAGAAAEVLRAADETRRCMAANPRRLLSSTREAVAVFFMAMHRFRAQHEVGLSDDIMHMLILPQSFTSAGGQAAALAEKLGVKAHHSLQYFRGYHD